MINWPADRLTFGEHTWVKACQQHTPLRVWLEGEPGRSLVYG